MIILDVFICIGSYHTFQKIEKAPKGLDHFVLSFLNNKLSSADILCIQSVDIHIYPVPSITAPENTLISAISFSFPSRHLLTWHRFASATHLITPDLASKAGLAYSGRSRAISVHRSFLLIQSAWPFLKLSDALSHRRENHRNTHIPITIYTPILK
jgi:hypothetical protein